ncbi:hypothetical protein [Erythrobacter aurantius]|uniref:hypothetical protein n=1 Tax=Erythrobacter aurantius TaxID=2909249 RepID=UPI0020794D9D|nr:hypothetical protein [Erythrobacter aurantius]
MSLLTILTSIILVLAAGWLLFLTLKLGALDSEVEESNTKLRKLDKKLMQDNRQRYNNLHSRIAELEDKLQSLRQESTAARYQLAKAEAVLPRENPTPTCSTVDNGAHDIQGDGDVQGARQFQDQLLADYNDLASEFTGVRRDNFVRKYSPVAVTHDAGRVVEQENGQFWLVRTARNTDCILVPIGKIAREWEKLYRSMNGLTAKQTFGDVFELVPGGNFRVLEPALADPLSHGGAIKQLGKLQGI